MLISRTVMTQPIYQQTHGPRTVRHVGSEIKGAVHAAVLADAPELSQLGRQRERTQ